jgi:hypothetical protein
MSPNKNLYDEIIQVSENFLGPAGERFIRRQIITHLGIEPEQLQKKHLPELVDWLRLALAVLSSDTSHVKDFGNQVLALGNKKNSMKAQHGSVR